MVEGDQTVPVGLSMEDYPVMDYPAEDYPVLDYPGEMDYDREEEEEMEGLDGKDVITN